jgi:hypothetical protein
MNLIYEDEVVAQLEQVPTAIEYTTVFGQPVYIVRGITDWAFITVTGKDTVIDWRGMRTLNYPLDEDDHGLIVFCQGLPEGHDFDPLHMVKRAD